MYEYSITIKDRNYSQLFKDKQDEMSLVEIHIKQDEVADFYANSVAFFEEYCTIFYEKTNLKLYLLSTNQSGWDTYDSAVYCAYNEEDACKMSEKAMSFNGEYKNTAEYIGIADKLCGRGEVCSSFNAG